MEYSSQVIIFEVEVSIPVTSNPAWGEVITGYITVREREVYVHGYLRWRICQLGEETTFRVSSVCAMSLLPQVEGVLT